MQRKYGREKVFVWVCLCISVLICLCECVCVCVCLCASEEKEDGERKSETKFVLHTEKREEKMCEIVKLIK